MAALNVAEIVGKLHSGVHHGTVANTTGTTGQTAAVWIVQNIYDVENAKGENRAALIQAIATAMGLYKGDF